MPQPQLDSVISHFAPQIAVALIRNIAGGATRADLDWFVDLLKKFMTRTVVARGLLERALEGLDAGLGVGGVEKGRFLKSVAV